MSVLVWLDRQNFFHWLFIVGLQFGTALRNLRGCHKSPQGGVMNKQTRYTGRREPFKIREALHLYIKPSRVEDIISLEKSIVKSFS